MDSTQLLIAVIGAYTAFTAAAGGVVVAIVNRSSRNGAKPSEAEPWNGGERRKGEFAQHINTCPVGVKFDKEIADLRKDMNTGFAGVHSRIDEIFRERR